MKIAILGANGFIGSALVKHLSRTFTVVGLTRDNYTEYQGHSFDIFINAAGQNSNHFAQINPEIDFNKSVLPVYNSFSDFNINKYIFLSSIATYDSDSNYGFNKKLSENIIKRYAKSYIILRCSSVINKEQNVGIIPDILNQKPLFITKDSVVQFITRDKLMQIIEQSISIETNEIFNIGGKDPIKIRKIGDNIKIPIMCKDNATYRKYAMDVSKTDAVFSLKSSMEYIQDIL